MNSIQNFSGQSFKSRYQLDVNQKMSDEKKRKYRDSMLGYYTGAAKNSDEIVNYIFRRAQNEADKSPWNVTIDLPDKLDSDFEKDMNKVGQNINKIV